jgi:hypothetical protein
MILGVQLAAWPEGEVIWDQLEETGEALESVIRWL